MDTKELSKKELEERIAQLEGILQGGVQAVTIVYLRGGAPLGVMTMGQPVVADLRLALLNVCAALDSKESVPAPPATEESASDET